MTFRFSFIYYVLILNFILKLTFCFIFPIDLQLPYGIKETAYSQLFICIIVDIKSYAKRALISDSFQVYHHVHYSCSPLFTMLSILHINILSMLLLFFHWYSVMIDKIITDFLFHVQDRQQRCKVVLIYLISHDENHSRCLP